MHTGTQPMNGTASAPSAALRTPNRSRRSIAVAAGAAAWLATAAVAGMLFATGLSLAELPTALWDGLSGAALDHRTSAGATDLSVVIVAEVNLPRVTMAALGGAAFAAAGLMLQQALSNELAVPELLGVAPGAALALATAQTFQLALPGWLVPLLGILGGSLAGLLVGVLAASMSTATGMLLVGASISAALNALLLSVMTAADGFQARALFRFLSGSLTDVTWVQVAPAVIWLGIGLAITPFTVPALGVLRLGQHGAAALGIAVSRARAAIVLLSVALVCVVVTVCGPIVWIGLLAPALTRGLLPRARSGWWLFVTALFGAAVAVSADVLARWSFHPLETPLGAWTAAVAMPPVLAVSLARRWRSARDTT